MKTNLEKLTGSSKIEMESLYLSSLDIMLELGFDEKTAREIAKSVFIDTVNRCAEIKLKTK